MPTQQDVLRAFDEIGDAWIHVGRLGAVLEQKGFFVPDVSQAIELAITDGVLVMSDDGGLRRKT